MGALGAAAVRGEETRPAHRFGASSQRERDAAKEMEERDRQAEERWAAHERASAAGASELRLPATVMVDRVIRMLEGDQADPDDQELVRRLRRLADLIDDWLAVGQLDSNIPARVGAHPRA